ncbi:MAG: glycoside hydrolase family 127 protein [Victivallaceae bacterium]|nr:glycoside hydrolase family 127 protein [Victivallaceae bacterium]
MSNKGLTAADVIVSQPIKFGRACPKPQFITKLNSKRQGSAVDSVVPIELLETAALARDAEIRFGFPLPKGAIYDLNHFQIIAPRGKKVAAQFSATAFWPDKSLKWVLIQFTAPLKSGEKASYRVRFGRKVKALNIKSNLKVIGSSSGMFVDNGIIKVQLGNNLIDKIWYKNRLIGGFSPDGIILTDENGNKFNSGLGTPKITVEESGPENVVVRFEGHYANRIGEKYMKYIARLSFQNNSSVVGLALTHINDYIATEFTDITSLTLPFMLPGKLKQTTVNLAGKSSPVTSKKQRIIQLDDIYSSISGQKQPGRLTGAATLNGSRKITLGWQDFWRRYPKAYKSTDKEFILEILPEQPTKDYGKNLPFYLLFPFCEGKYRFKWGMAFTERLRFDFSGSIPAKVLQTELDSPVIAVIPASWYAKTNAFANVTAPQGKQFFAWDTFVNKSYQAHMILKNRQREFGYFNYGDWYGERGRNWGNNEYDLAHGLFAAFVRTGNRDYYRWAMKAAKHQADVDIVHAYPNPYYLGANHQHSIGHTGTWSQRPKHATWTHAYDSHTSAQSGHTWSKGMVEAWMLSGDPVIMESTLKLGEHIIWAMAPSFKRLGTHERTAGWSIKAILPLYNLTNDPLYLKAAKQIATVALNEQKINGAWPHRLPKDHAWGRTDAWGNNLFLLGILTSSLKDYHQATGDQKVKKSLLAAVDWICKSYDPQVGAWPYSALKDGTPLGAPRSSSNLLVIDTIAYAAKITGKKSYADIARDAMLTRIITGAGANGKSIAQSLVFTDSTMKSLHDYYAKYAPKQADKVVTMEDIARRTTMVQDTAKFNVRGPKVKTFYVKLKKPTATITLNRKKHGARPHGWDKCFGAVYNTQGKKIESFEYKPTAEISRRIKLSGKPGAIFKVVFRDDLRGVWDVAGKDVQVILKLTKGTSLGRPAIARFYLTVPKGTKQFKIHIRGVHTGAYGMLLQLPNGKIAIMKEGINTGKVLLPWSNGIEHRQSAEYSATINVPSWQAGKIWPLIIWGSGDIGLQVEGIPPYLSRNKAMAFKVK